MTSMVGSLTMNWEGTTMDLTSPKRRSSLFESRLNSLSRHGSHILDEIRNDPDLLLDDSAEEPESSRSPPVNRTNQSSSPNRATISRHTSFSKMPIQNLQREVDLALEMFTRENSDDEDELLENNNFSLLEKTSLRFESEESGSYPGTASTSLATSCDYDLCDGSSKLEDMEQAPRSIEGLSLKHRTKSILSLPLSLLPSKPLMTSLSEEQSDCKFDAVVSVKLANLGITKEQHEDRSFAIDFSLIRSEMEPFLASARIQRDEARRRVHDTFDFLNQAAGASRRGSLVNTASRRGSLCSEGPIHIGSNYGIPYPDIRNETRFLYDVDSYPIDKLLADTLGVQDLSLIHLKHPVSKDKSRLMAPLQNRGQRRAFHRCFDSFVTSHVIPLLHSQALSKGIFYSNRHQLKKGKPQRIIYRYQAFPTINIVRPGECSIGPHCDLNQGHSIGNISFHIPLTAAFGTNAVHVESRPGREDWHPLSTKSPGLGFYFDGARCLHFNLRNETDITRVSINFSIAITRDCNETEYDPDDQLCCPQLMKDEFSSGKEGYYDEVTVNVGDVNRSFLPGPVAMKKPCSQNRLYDPDERLGFPFAM